MLAGAMLSRHCTRTNGRAMAILQCVYGGQVSEGMGEPGNKKGGRGDNDEIFYVPNSGGMWRGHSILVGTGTGTGTGTGNKRELKLLMIGSKLMSCGFHTFRRLPVGAQGRCGLGGDITSSLNMCEEEQSNEWTSREFWFLAVSFSFSLVPLFLLTIYPL
ncbi:hypothetical protein SODALDRAFT_211890 [Sodiomyces alkalinus F11]|uniref:Uncharacterized protein n=1 Tax=Sodiomyces alkalinus (strain CBS 110278 / VKM F-3762 / F11) TaxID=1314773 RepID=A0A3N2PR24_SODAK|nr:hypothetical protein SODALDRAFT_211890 [Sodiomyces alkalinus F11]ROT36962.1 hypothetical protein SODALDRAFT_211890 [Sodiomyces alkalinus F11]